MLRWFDSLPSTMDAAHDLASAGALHGAAVAAREQTRGRGRRGRSWTSPPGGLWLSVVCRPRDGVVPEGLGIRIGLAVSDAIERAVPRIPPLRLKWPNDLYLHQRKAGGILCEARWDGDRLAWIVAGIGINVRNPIPDDLRPTATSLGEFDPDLTPESLAQPVATAVAEASARPGPLTPAELEQFAAKDWLRGRRLATPVAGYAAGIAPDGTLLVGTTEGTVRVPVAESVGLECRGD